MKNIDIYLVVSESDGSVKVIDGGTDYNYVSAKFDDAVMAHDPKNTKLVTLRLPEIILTGNEELVDLTKQVN